MALNTTFGSVNPLVKEEPIPDYLKLSHAISEPKPDTSMGTILKGAGDLLKGGIEATTDLIKKHISDEAYRRIDIEREGYTADLKDIAPGGGGIRRRGGAGGTIPATEDGEGGEALSYAPVEPGAAEAFARAPGGAEIIPAEGTDAPELVNAKLRYAEFLNNALKGGTVSPTFYVGNINDIAKSLRAEHPGFRDYIDQEISRITGMNPANTMIQSLTRDINSHLVAAGTDKSMTMGMQIIKKVNDDGLDVNAFNKEGERIHPTSAMMMQALQAGKVTLPQVLEWSSEMRKLQGIESATRTRLNTLTGGRDIDRLEIGRAVNIDAPTLMDKYMTSIYSADGINLRKPSELREQIRRAQAGQTVLDSAGQPVNSLWWMRQAESLDVVISKATEELEQVYIYNKDEKGQTIASKYGENGVQIIRAQIAQSMEPFRAAQKAILDKDVGIATQIVRYNKAVIDDAFGAQVLSNHPISKYLIGTQIAERFGAKELSTKLTADMMTKVENSPIVVQTWLDSLLLGALTNHMPGSRLPFTNTPPGQVPPPGATTTPATPGVGRRSALEPPTTLAAGIDEATEAGKREPAFKDPKLFTSLIDVVKYVNDPAAPDDAKRGFLTYAFNPGKDGDYRILQKFEVDKYVGPVRVPGRFSTFETFTSPDIVATAKRLSGDKWNFKTLFDWTEANFSGPLVGNELSTLSAVKNPNITFSWDPKTRTLSPVINNNLLTREIGPYRAEEEGDRTSAYARRLAQQAAQRELNQIQPSVDRLNTAFRGLGNVYDAVDMGDQIEKRIVGMLAASGIRGNKVTFDVLKGIIEGKVGPEAPATPPAAPPTPRTGDKGARLDEGPGVGLPMSGRRVAYFGDLNPEDAFYVNTPRRASVGRFPTTNLSNERLVDITEVP